jgi:DNA processing protein
MERAYWLAWSKMPRIGSVLLKRISQGFDSLATAWAASGQELATIDGLGNQTIEGIIAARRELEPLNLLADYEKNNSAFWTPADPEYPQLLWEIPDPPAVLFHKGILETWQERSAIAIIGTRHPTAYGRRWAKKIAQALAENGFIVVSGLAEGIDAEAHQACLDAQGKSLAVVGTGVDRVYPAKHLKLYQELMQSGAVISEYANGTSPERSHFPQRNRIIAGLCRASIVIEAPASSGALITAYQANDYGRDVFALPGSLDVEQAYGCLNLINKGAQVILGIDQLMEALGNIPQLDQVDQTTRTVPAVPMNISLLEPSQQKIMSLLGFNESVSFDHLVEASNLPVGEISAALSYLEIMGAIAPMPGMRYQRLT